MRFIAALLIATGVAVVSLPAQSADPWIGTWKVDLARSTYSPGPKPTAGATVKIEQAPGGAMKTTIDAVDPSGRPTHTETVGMFEVMTLVTVSADGKTLTATQTGTTGEGGAIEHVILADRR